MSLRDAILNCEDLPLEAVEVSEWNTTVYVRNMTGTERDAYETSLLAKQDMTNEERLKDMRAALVVLCTVDEDGVRIFSDNDVEAVGAKSANALDKIVMAIRKHNGLTDGDIEEESKNSEPSGSEDSISD